MVGVMWTAYGLELRVLERLEEGLVHGCGPRGACHKDGDGGNIDPRVLFATLCAAPVRKMVFGTFSLLCLLCEVKRSVRWPGLVCAEAGPRTSSS